MGGLNAKRLAGIWVLLVLCLALFLAACPGRNPSALTDEEFTIQVAGDNGQAFAGSYVLLKADGSISSVDISGNAPRTYKVQGLQVDLTVRKATSTGYLDVKITKGKDLVAEGSVSHAFGSLNLIAH